MPFEKGVDPCDQLKPITQAIASPFPSLDGVDECSRWADGTEEGFGRAGTLLRHRKFASVLAGELDTWLDQEPRSEKYLIVIAFSAGGMIFYRWLAERGRKEETERILSAFVIASPYQCMDGYVVFENDPEQKRHPFKEPRISCDQIVANLDPGKLTVILAGQDGTIKRRDSEIDQEYIQSGMVIQETVPEAKHLSICKDPRTHDIIVRRLRNVLG
jgi:hypothetical protein